MAKVKITLDSEGIRRLLCSDEIADVCKNEAERVLANCGGVSGYELERRVRSDRIGYGVVAKEYPAIGNNLKHNTLLKALGK